MQLKCDLEPHCQEEPFLTTLIVREPPDRRNLVPGPVLPTLAVALPRLEAREVGDSMGLLEVQVLQCQIQADRKVRPVVGRVEHMFPLLRRTAFSAL